MISTQMKASYKLAPMQQGMLFQHRLEPGSGVDIEQMIFTLHEKLDVVAFKKAWEVVVSRHDVLRTSFQWEGTEEPLQHVYSNVDLPFTFEDCQDIPKEKCQNKLKDYMTQDRKKGFDLADVPLMRLAVFCFGETDYRVIWTFHHIILDGRSHPIVINEVFAVYEANQQGKDIVLAPPRQYQNYIEWLNRQDFSKSESFWRRSLEGFIAPTPIDTIPKVDRHGENDVNNGEMDIVIAESVTASLKTVAKKHNLSLRTMIQGGWALLLSRYSGENDIVFGEVRACRRDTIEDADSVVGLFINTLPVRVTFSHNHNLTTCLKTLRDQSLAARNYEHTPLVQILAWSEVRQDTPLFESVFVYDTYELSTKLSEQGENWEKRDFSLFEKTLFPLALYAYADQKLSLKMSYDKRRFDDAIVKQMLGNLKVLLESMAENIDRPASYLPILTEDEKHQLLAIWTDTFADFPKDSSLHGLFEEQAARTPDNIALVFDGSELTYKEMNNRSNQLARYLQKRGVGRDVLVGIFMDRSIEMVIGIYGILKAGGAYVPLDPEYPLERVAFMVQDSKVPVLLTQKKLMSMLPPNEAEIICLDSDWPKIALENTRNESSGVTADNLVYVIYTSGSTGIPKGVMVTHRGICNFLLSMQEIYPLSEEDRVLQKTPLNFDAICVELFRPWLVGARLIAAKPGGQKDNNYLIHLIRDQGITTIFFVPSMLQIFLDEKDVEKCTSLKHVYYGGEPLSYELQEYFFSKLLAQLHNCYGPTETTVAVTFWTCKRHSDRRIIPIGYPVANTQIYILDAHLQPVPIGVAGELCVGGNQIARGYLNRPDLTVEKFIDDPFSKTAGARLYRTGDLARYLPGGEIEYLGRTDHQVKIRGFRIELGEIEAVLGGHKDISKVMVIVREDLPGDKQLAAYIVPKGARTLSQIELRNYLNEHLPEYMVPSAFVLLDKFPLTPSGKIDRKALPVPESLGMMSEVEYVAPRTEIERTITDIWQIVLHVEKIGVNDNFFDLGGHSLRMAQVHSKLREKLQRELSMLELFKYPTIHSLSQHLSRGGDEQISAKNDDRIEKLKEGRSRMKKRFSSREQADQLERRLQDE
jgi:microcystin synthetase protein McyB